MAFKTKHTRGITAGVFLGNAITVEGISVFAILQMLIVMTTASADRQPVQKPPTILQHPEPELTFKRGEKVELPCTANGDPAPSHYWKKNGKDLTISGINVQQSPNSGTITIEEPGSSHEGSYQCFAHNAFGTAASVVSVLKRALQESFPTIKEPKLHKPIIGSPLTLRCNPPYSYPSATVYWGENRERLKPIDNTDRISLDYEGNMYFVNVMPEDSSPGNSMYTCAAFNTFIRSTVQGDDQRIEVQTRSGTPSYKAPGVMWSFAPNQITLKGQTKKMKCIFSGYPTPNVTWDRIDAPMPTKVVRSSSGQEIKIPEADYSDGGKYRCSATNSPSGHPAFKDITLNVESPPYWKEDKQPEDVNTSDEESAHFTCQVLGIPKPTISWFINGKPVEELPENPRRTIDQKTNTLRYTNVSASDNQVVQCNASNKHGYIFANAYLNVFAEAPYFKITPEGVVKVAEGQNTMLKCHAFGAPKLIIVWTKDNELLSKERFIKEDSGNLKILDVRLEDDGTYKCQASNKFGKDDVTGRLLVRKKTQIFAPPHHQTVNASADVIFRCNATTDPEERSKLRINWLKNGERIDFEREGSISKNILDNSLRITQAQVSDSGNYTCSASNELDSDSVTVLFIVKGRPDPPVKIQMSCTSSRTEISWTPGSENNDPISQYIIYYNMAFEPGIFHEANTVPHSKKSATFHLKRWTNYTFSGKAKNSLGLSDRSPFTTDLCETPPMKPMRSPRKVCTDSKKPDQLVIVWEPMLINEHNGPGFHYEVGYKWRGQDDAKEVVHKEHDWKQSELIVEGQETFKEYEIFVRAINEVGPAHTVEKKIGYSGQGVPMDEPQNFHIKDGTLNSTSATFVWDPVDESTERVLGFFRGYQIRFWKTHDPQTYRVEDVILRSWEPCSTLPSNRRGRRSSGDGKSVTAHTNRLWPYSEITAGVLVLNAGTSGKLGDTINFTTPEGVPSVVTNFRVVERGSHHFKLQWEQPAEINGVLLGYEIEYKKTPPAIDHRKLQKILNPLQTGKKILELDNSTGYIIYIYGLTKTGRGAEIYLEDRTLVASVPSQPIIDDVMIGDDFVNISWFPVPEVAHNPAHNPGSSFSVEYKKIESPESGALKEEWIQTPFEDEQNWMNVSNLEHGATYDFRIVARNHGGDENKSDLRRIKVISKDHAPVQSTIASAGWFIGLLCAIIFLLLLLLLVCIIKCNRGGKYAVHEKEKLRGHESNRDDDEADFGEYTRTEDPDLHKSKGSMESEKPLDSETDSLGEYEDPDPSKFNEDGSFIGQYGGKKKSMDRFEQDTTTPSALSTFV